MVTKLPEQTIQDMKDHARQIVATYSRRDEDLFSRYREMYFMEDETRRPSNSQVDERDWAVTVSPSSHNEVTGMVRLLDTSEIGVTVKAGKDKARTADKIEDGLKTILRVSGETRRARIETDSALSAVLFGPVVLYFESVDDLIAVAKNKYRKAQLADIRKRTPVLIRTIPADQSYPEWGEFGLISHTWKYKIKGGVLKERWGVDAKPDIDYTVYDIYDCENRLVYSDELGTLFAGEHGLTEIPIKVRYSGGTSLFNEPERQLNSFLYSKAKSRLDKRENAALTAMATAINIRGLMGPLLSLDPENTPEEITVDYQGGVRYIRAKATQVDDKVIDPVVFQWMNKLNELGGESTIYKQTLGQNIDAGTFSGLAMLSSAGKLPLVDPQRGIEMAFRDVFLGICRRIKEEGIANDVLAPEDIPADIDIEVRLDPKLPQDQLRNAQVAQNIGDLVSDEWKHSNLLQISDSAEMRKQVTKETITKAIVQNIISNPQMMQPFISAAMGQPAQPQQPPQQPTPPPQQPGLPGMDGGQMAPEMMGQGMGDSMGGQMMGEQVPQSGPMIPPMERM